MKRILTDDEWKIREVQTALDGICEKHGQLYGSTTCGDCQHERECLRFIEQGVMCPRHKQPFDGYKVQMPYRTVLWGVNLEKGVEVSNALVKAGITEFRITSDRWLTIHMSKAITVRSLLKKDSK